MPLDWGDKRKLIGLAKEAMKNAYAPYSHFKVGAAVLCADGSLYKGCNVENASYGAAVCAERNALFAAVADGKKDFKALAVVCSGEDFAFPCGICRQVISELAPRAEIILENLQGEVREYAVNELLPEAFALHNREEFTNEAGN